MVLYGKIASNLARKEAIEAPKEKLIGLTWPTGTNPKAPYFNKNSSLALIRSQVIQFLRTSKGERVMLPNFGASLKDFIFEPLSRDMASVMATSIIDGLALYAPNIVIRRIRFFQSDNLTGFGLPGIKVEMDISPRNNTEIINIKVNI